jgi:hypothetical protein
VQELVREMVREDMRLLIESEGGKAALAAVAAAGGAAAAEGSAAAAFAAGVPALNTPLTALATQLAQTPPTSPAL